MEIQTTVDFPTALLEAQAFEKKKKKRFDLKVLYSVTHEDSFSLILTQSCKDSKLILPHTHSWEVIGRCVQLSKDLNFEKEKARIEEKANPKYEVPTAYPV